MDFTTEDTEMREAKLRFSLCPLCLCGEYMLMLCLGSNL